MQFYLHEDEWGMIALEPAEAAPERRRVVAEAEAHGEAHAVPGGGWSKLYVAPDSPVKLDLTLAALRTALGDEWIAFESVTSEFIEYPGIKLAPFAFHQVPLDEDFDNVIYGLCEGDRIDQLCITRCRPAMADTLRRLCTTFHLIISDLWWNEVIVPDDDVPLFERYLSGAPDPAD